MAVARALSSAATSPDTFMQGSNSLYVEEMYHAWRKDPSSVHKSWDVYFQAMDRGLLPEHSFVPPPRVLEVPTAVPAAAGQVALPAAADAMASDSLGIAYLIRAYQVRGHEKANLDPLGI
ncbi:unnamed protein product, partial [Phaeothamnion confervicola]